MEWLDESTLEACKHQIRAGLSPRSRLLAEITDALVEDQLRIVPALAEIVSAEEPPGRACDLRITMRDQLQKQIASLRFDPQKAELIIDIQMRVVPRLLRTLDTILAEKGL